MKQALAVVLFAFLLSGCLTGPTHTSGRVTVHGDHGSVSIAFTDHERDLINRYYLKKRKRLPPGLAKKRKLPPGLAKRKQLPPGLRHRDLPHDLHRQLRRLPDNYVRVKVGHDVVLMDKNTRVVFDIIVGVD